MSGLALRLLGSPQITLGGAAVRFDTRKAVALLAYLACTGSAHTRDALAVLLWPEYADARNALRRTLSALQHTLGTGWLDISRDQVALARRADLWLDAAQFAAQTGPASERDVLAAGLALYRDDFMAGFTLRDSIAFDEWQLFEAERLRQRFALGLDRLAGLYAGAGEHDQAIEVARRRLALDPLHEPAHRTLMQLYAAAGQRTAALRQYRACAQRLEQEFGATPADETVRLYELIQSAATPAPATTRIAPAPQRPLRPRAAPVATPLVGREPEQARLLSLYAHGGAGGLAAITGQPGIGKTRLAEALLAAARQSGGVTLAARCYEGESALAYAPVAALLRAALGALDRAGRLGDLRSDQLAEAARLIPDLARSGQFADLQPLAGPEARRHFFEAVADVLFSACAAAAPGVLLVDDAHWADGASLDLLAFFARRTHGQPALLLLTWRDEDVPAGHPLRAMLAEARRLGTAEHIALGPLSPAAVETLARAGGELLSPALAARLHNESAGLPLLVVELLAALRDGGLRADDSDWPLPTRARDLLDARLRTLSDAARALLSAASVVGRAFDLPTLSAAVGAGEESMLDDLDDLLARGLLVEATATPLRYAFGHERLRAVVYERLSRARRRMLHRRVAAHLSAQLAAGARPGLAGQVAYHAAAAGESGLAAAHHRLAGDEARALAANAEAATHYAAALELGHPDTAALHESLGDLRALAGDYPAALSHYDAARRAGRAVARKTGEVHHRLGEWGAAAAQFAAVIGDGAADLAERALAAAAWSLTERRRGDVGRAADLANDALGWAEAAADPRARSRAHGAAGAVASQLGDQAAALTHLERGLSLAEQVDDPEARVAAMNSLALAVAPGDPARAIALAERALTLCLARDDRHRAAALHNTLADLRHATGDIELARSHLRDAVTLFAAIGHDQPAIWMLTEW